MASFAQSQPIQFAPYTPSFDVPTYVQVGLAKQGQYDIGVQRIQNTVDSVASLQLMRPQDKDYLQQKLDATLSGLNSRGGADFSDSRVVSQLSAQAAAVANDPYVQTAVSSTMDAKAFMQSQKELKEKHPDLYTQAWEEHQNEGLQQWLTDPSAGKSYNGPKTAAAYTNYRDALNEQLKGIAPDITTEITPDGQFQYKTEKRSEVTDARIKSVIQSYFATNPGAQESMLADAKFTYKGITPQGLAASISGYTQETTTALQAQNTQLTELIKNNPGATDYITDLQNKILDNQTMIASMQQKEKDYLKQLSDPANLDRVKFGLYNDSFSNGLSLRYKKEDIDRSLSQNFNAVQAREQANSDRTYSLSAMQYQLSALKEGLQVGANGNLEPISPDSPYYSWWVQSGGNSNNGKGTGGLQYNGTPQNEAELEKTLPFTEENLQGQIKGLREKIGMGQDGAILQGSPLDRYRNKWYSFAERTDPNWNKYTPQQKAAQFNNYYQTQEQKFVNGEDTDPRYKEFRQMIYADQSQLATLQALDKEAKQYAVGAVPISGKVTIDVKPYQSVHNGHVYSKIEVTNGNELSNTLVDFFKKYDVLNKNQAATVSFSDAERGVGPDPLKGKDKAVQDLLASYRNSPHYEELYHIINSNPNLISLRNKVVKPIEDQVKQRDHAAEQYLQEHGKGFNNLIYSFGAKEENLKAARNKIWQDLTATAHGEDKAVTLNDGTYSLKKHTAEDITPIGQVRGNDGKIYWKFQIKGNKPAYILSTEQKDNLPNKDEYDWLVRMIDANGQTPSSGAGALSTYSGRVRYQIEKGLSDGTYDINIIVKGSPQPIELHVNPTDHSSPLQKIYHPRQVVDAISKLETQLNQTYGIHCDSEDVLKALSTAPSDFNQYIKRKYGK